MPCAIGCRRFHLVFSCILSKCGNEKCIQVEMNSCSGGLAGLHFPRLQNYYWTAVTLWCLRSPALEAMTYNALDRRKMSHRPYLTFNYLMRYSVLAVHTPWEDCFLIAVLHACQLTEDMIAHRSVQSVVRSQELPDHALAFYLRAAGVFKLITVQTVKDLLYKYSKQIAFMYFLPHKI